jgi:hypothetical protein
MELRFAVSFSDDDKEALGEDLDDLKTSLNAVKERATSIDKNLRTLVTMAWVVIVISVATTVLMVVTILNSQ